jgi:putative endonuclease
MEKQFYVYILTSKMNGTLYVGITSDLVKRIWEHKNEITEGFTKKHKVKTLVYFETFSDPENAIKREKTLKKWPRQWKLNVINEQNPEWNDLYETICK